MQVNNFSNPINNSLSSFEFASEAIKNDKPIIAAVIEQGSPLKFATNQIINNAQFVRAVLRNNEPELSNPCLKFKKF